MNILDLDEAQGLAREMVDRYLDRAGWCHMPDPEQRLLKPQYVHVSFKMGIGAAIELIASITGCAPQFLLREINPRMRKGMPSKAALRAHRGLWLRSIGTDTIATVLSLLLDEFPSRRDNESYFWPCDDNGNKTRWPTDAEGNML